MTASHIQATVDFSEEGKQHGHLCAPRTTDAAGNASPKVPIAVVARGMGPTALVVATGDDGASAGQIAILRLMRTIEPQQISGRLILIPHMSLPFAEGTPSNILDKFVGTALFPLADIVIEICGRRQPLEYYPSVHVHSVDDRAQRRQMVDGASAWNADFAVLHDDVAGHPLPLEAERQGKIVIIAEMGVGEPVPAAVHQMTQRGLENVLSHFGLLAGRIVTRGDSNLPPTRWVRAAGSSGERFAPESGLYESLLPLGASVTAGQLIGTIHFPEQPERESQPVVAHADGVLLATRALSRVTQGDAVASIASEIDPG